MNNNINYYNKYLKYKIKYNALCNTLIKQTGGGCDDATKKIIEQSLITLSDYNNIKLFNKINNLKIALLIDNVRVLGNLYKEEDDSYIFCIFDTKSKLYIFKNMTLEEVCTAYTKTSQSYVPPQRQVVNNNAIPLDTNMPVAVKTSHSYVEKQVVEELQIIKTNSKIIIDDSLNHINYGEKLPKFTDFQSNEYLEKSVQYLLKYNITNNIILVDGLNIIRKLDRCLFVLDLIKKKIPYKDYIYFKVRITFIEKFQKNPSDINRHTYNKYSTDLLEYFIPYILDYFKLQYPDYNNYNFVICCLNQVNNKYNIFQTNTLLYIMLPNNKEYDDFLLLLLYSYFKNILKSEHIYIYSFDDYQWWPNDKNAKNGDKYDNYKLEFKRS